MIINKNTILRLAFFLMMLSIFFSYYEISGIRLLVVSNLISLLLIFFIKGKILFLEEISIFFILIIYIFIMGIYVENLNLFFSSVMFFILMCWSSVIDKRVISIRNIDFCLNLYIFFGFLSGVGLILQVLLFSKGIEFGKIDTLGGNRIGFGFLWMDYSFFSLYLSSIVPLVLYSKFNLSLKIFLVPFFMIASVLTSARTGFFSLIIFYFSFIIILIFYRVFIERKINIVNMIFGLIFLLFSLFVVIQLTILFPRMTELGSSGRSEGYEVGFNFFLDNVWFGSFYTFDLFPKVVPVPHNMFMFNLFLGGGIFFMIFMIWFVFLIKRLYFSCHQGLKQSIIIILIGLQFIPAPFTAYFFAFLISLVIYHRRISFC